MLTPKNVPAKDGDSTKFLLSGNRLAGPALSKRCTADYFSKLKLSVKQYRACHFDLPLPLL